MADGTVSGDPATSEEQGSGGVPDVDAEGGLTDAQRELLERCLRALQQAENDSHTLAALLLITRVCPANQLDRATLKRIFEAVGLSLPARLLVTAVRGTDSSSLPPHQLLSLGTALLAALSTDPDMAAHPQLLASVPILLALLADGPASQRQQRRRCEKPPSQSGSAVIFMHLRKPKYALNSIMWRQSAFPQRAKARLDSYEKHSFLVRVKL